MEENEVTTSHILLVDDESSLRLTFEMFLKRAGYGPIISVSTLEEAVDAIEKNDFDLVISDILLEGASGIDVLRRVKELGRKTPVVMVTGYPSIETAAEAVRLGAFDYVPKPVKKDNLLQIAKSALEKRALQKKIDRTEEVKEKDRYSQEAILRSVREIIITIDPQLRVVDMNDMAIEWTRSFLPDFQIGVSLPSVPGELAKTFCDDVEFVQKKHAQRGEHRFEWQKKDGSQGMLTIVAAPLEDGRKNFLGVVLTARDITHLDDVAQDDRPSKFHRLMGQSMAMQRVFNLIKNVGQVDTTVLITGESGTGKELVAEALHAESPRSKGPLVKVDCTAIPENLLESELFGHRKGAFTGADRDRRGRILQADGGTIFLDEIGDISPRMQLRFLRFLQERTFYPVGRDNPVHVDVRVIAATNADLKQKVRDELFREDLYFRLRVVDVMLPPLREREGDISLLANYFLSRFVKQMKKEINGFSDQAMEYLQNYSWPGNVREFEHAVERACVLCKGGTITTEHLPVDIVPENAMAEAEAPSAGEPDAAGADRSVMPASEKERIIYALQVAGGNKAKAARLLEIDRSTLYRKLLYYNIDPSSFDIAE